MPSSTNVTTGKPKVAGAIYIADVGSTLPTDATSALAEAFTELGYVSDDGLSNSHSGTVNKIHAWGGDVVLVTQEDMEDQFDLTLIEAAKPEVLKAVLGDDNVTGTMTGSGASGVTAKFNAKEPVAKSWVFELIYSNNVVKRIVIPKGIVSEVGEVTYTDSDAVGYPITIDALADSSGNTHYEYMAVSE